MKLLAVLKDSFRESIDAKVFYVMVAMSLALIIFVAGLSFTPEPPDEMMKFLSLSLNGDILAVLQGQKPTLPESRPLAVFEIKSSEPIDGGAPTPDSVYRVTVRVGFANAQERDKVKADPQPTMDFIKERFASAGEDFRIYNVSDVEPIPSPASNPALSEAYFQFQAHPTVATRRVWPHRLRLYSAKLPLIEDNPFPLGFEVWFIEDLMVNGWGAWIAILMSVVVTSLFIPNMVQKGAVEMLLVKPISRPLLLTYKYLGGLIFMFLNTAFVVLGIWLVIGLRSGIWATGFLLTIFIMTFFFAILYSVSTLFGVLTRSAIVSILMTCLVWFFLFGVGTWYLWAEGKRVEQVAGKATLETPVTSQWWYVVPRVLHFAIPRTKDLDHLTSRVLMRDLVTANQIKDEKLDPTDVNWTESISASLAFIAVLLGVSCWRFSARDY